MNASLVLINYLTIKLYRLYGIRDPCPKFTNEGVFIDQCLAWHLVVINNIA